jgi:hypothetical protein
LELVAKKQDEILEPLYNDIVITKESFTPEEKKIFSYNVLKQSLAAIAADTDKPVDAAYYVGSLTEEEFSAKSEEFYAHQDKYRNKPDGKISYITAWVCRQI